MMAAPEFSTVGVEEAIGRFASEHLAQKLTERGLRVVTAKEMTALIGVERRRQLLGCDSSSCLSELGDALGADTLLMGELARIGKLLQVNVKVVSARGGGTRATFSKRLTSDDGLLDALDQAAEVLAEQLAPARVGGKGARTGRGPSLAAGVVAGVALVGSGFCWWQAKEANSQLRALPSAETPPLTVAQADELVGRGTGFQLAAQLALGVGVAAAGTAVLLLLPPRSESRASVTPVVGPGIAGALLRVQLP
jgi:hypothetical protein